MSDLTGSKRVLGIDLSDSKFEACLIDQTGEVVERQQQRLTPSGLARVLDREECLRVVIEIGTHSPWVSRICEEYGHETFVANPRQVSLIHKSAKKNDRNDAEKLARVGRLDPKLLAPIRHRGERAQADLAQIRSRDLLVRTRSSLVTHVRNSVKSFGGRLPSCSAAAFHNRVQGEIPDELLPALLPVIQQIATLTSQIRQLDRAIQQHCEVNYPETARLQQVTGVGSLTALAFVLVLEDPERFAKSRSVACYLGLTPKEDESGDTRKQLGITKQGDKLLRRLLIGSAQYILGPFGPECDLRTWGESRMKHGGKNAKKRAVVAVARKLAVLLHSLWKSGEAYDPHRERDRRRRGSPDQAA